MNKLYFFLLLFIPSTAYTQEAPSKPPVPVEVLIGNNRVFFQVVFNTPISAKWNYLSLNVARVDYQNKDKFNEGLLINLATYSLNKTVRIVGGAQLHSVRGLVPSVGFQFVKANPSWTVFALPLITFLPDRAFEMISFLEFKPKIEDKLRLYSRVQTMYNYSLTNEHHGRSFLQLRLGLSHKRMTYGVGADYDYYGKDSFKYENYGAFLKLNL